MRIVYLVNSRWPTIRGAERLLLKLMDYGRSEGHDISAIAPAASGFHRVCAEAGFRCEVAEFTLVPPNVRRLRALLRDLQPDIVHGMSIFPVAFVRRLGLAPSPKRTRFFGYVSTDPTSLLPVASRHFRKTLLFARNTVSRWEAPRLDAIFTASRMVAERLAATGIHGRIIPVPGHIDAEELAEDAKSPIDLPAGSPRIGYVGYLEPLKGIGDLVVAFAEVVKHYPGAVLLVAGDGPDRDQLLALAASLGVADRVTLLGFVEPVAPMLAALDIFVSPSRSEALGTSILEAMAFGVPCVCANSGGPAEFIRDGENGLLVPTRDPRALAEAVVRLADDPVLASQLAQRGCATVMEGTYLVSSTLQTVFAEYGRAMNSGGDAA